MPHQRPRHLKMLLQKTLQFSPIVGIFGHRQVGKTTLSELLADKYVTLDDAMSFAEANTSPETILSRLAAKPLVIDECQLAPPLFPAMKEFVRTRKMPGQILLTGSVRFTSRKAIRESLTGRIIAWELLPMDLAEQNACSLRKSIPTLISSKSVEVHLTWSSYFTDKTVQNYLQMGGLPGLFGLRNLAVQKQRFETQLNTILERDLKLIVPTTLPYRTLRNLLVVLATRIGQPLEISEISRATRISAPTVRKLIAALESMFVIRISPSQGLSKKPTLFFEDIGEANYLLAQSSSDSISWMSFLYQNLRTQTLYRPELGIHFFSFRSKVGDSIPVCFKKGVDILGIFPTDDSATSLEQGLAAAKSFLKNYPNAKFLIVGRQKRDELLAKNIRWLGAGYLI